MNVWVLLVVLAWAGSGLGCLFWAVPGARIRDARDVLMMSLCALCGPILFLSVLIEDAFRKRDEP